MSYITVAIVVEGALDGEHVCKTIEEVNALADEACAAGLLDGLRTEVWVLAHDHDPPKDEDDGCSCVQYLSDHAPFRTYIPEEEPA